MPNIIDADGLQTATEAELVADFTTAMQTIYGADIDLSSNSPDGQMMRIFLQAVLDLEDLLVQIYNMFDPDNAIGVILDQRVAINGIQRQAGTFTVQNVTITNTASLTLYGLDQEEQPVYTVADNAGNEWKLIATTNLPVPADNVLAFRAAVPGAVQSGVNTITVPVTIVLGISEINNPTTYTSLGINEESDAVLKVRRQKSVSLASQGYLAGLLAALENINGITSAFVYENTGSSPDGDGVPGHSIWVIVGGTADEAEIAQAIYTKRNAGCGMFGSQSYVITQVDGSFFEVFWDNVETDNLFIVFTATSIDGTDQPQIAAIRAGLPELYIPGVNEEVNINKLATYVQEIDPNCLVTDAGFSDGRTQVLELSGVAASGAFVLNYNGESTGSIAWNASAGTIQTELQGLTGLSGALVTGSIASQTLTINLAAVDVIQSLITVTSNTLATSAPAPVTFSLDLGLTPTLETASKNKQFAIASENIIITPMILSPVTATVENGDEQQFTGLGGYGTYTYSISVNNSGGSINASSGLYEAGSTPSVTDTVLVTDELGNTATATVTVI